MNDILKKYTVKKSVVQQGFIIPALLALIITFGTLMIVVSGVISNTLGSAARNQSSQVAINIAEAGINYYLWHMSHNSGDYKDGTTAAQTPDSVLGYAPYVHDYKDSTGAKRGTFTLYIKPGENGSNVTTVRSEAKQVVYVSCSPETLVHRHLVHTLLPVTPSCGSARLKPLMAPCTRT